MGRAPCCDKANVKKGPWSPEEDAKLKTHIEEYGMAGSNWTSLPHKIGLKRCGKSCRLRWLNYLRPNIRRGSFTEEEDSIICSLYVSIGSRWSVIAAQLPGRTDNDIKNYWNTKLKKKLLGRREQGNARACPVMNIGADGLQADSSYQSELSESALEGLQLHMKLQSPQNPLSNFNDNPALWPELLHPLLRAEKMIQSLQLQQQQTLGHNLNLHAPGLECCDSTTGSRIENEVDVGYYLPAMTSTGADLQHDSPKVLPRNVELGTYSDTAYDGSGSLAFGPVISISPCSSDSIPMNYRGNITGLNTDKLLEVQNNTAELEKTVISRAGGIMPQDEQPSDGLDYFEASIGSKDSMVWWSGDTQIESGFGQSTPWHTTSLIHHQGAF